MSDSYVTRYVESSVDALIVSTTLLEACTPFRMEPYPNDWWRVDLKQNALRQMTEHGSLAVSLYDTPQLPDEEPADAEYAT